MKKFICITLVIALLIGMTSVSFADTVTSAMYEEQLKEINIVDVNPNNGEAVNAIIIAVKAGLMDNEEGENFRPQSALSIQSTAAIIIKIIGQDTGLKTEAELVQKAQSLNILDTKVATNTTEKTSRLDMAIMMARAMDIKPLTAAEMKNSPIKDLNKIPAEYQGIIAALYQKGLFKGFEDGTFRYDQELTKEQMAILISRMLRK
ncbi:MAG: S-layer homology domain-containing protein [Lutisporaceae bacterium]